MTAALFFSLLAIAFWVWFFKVFFEKPPAEPRDTSFKVAIKRGELEVFIYYESRNPIQPSLERIVRRWALQVEIAGQPSRAVYDALESELIRQFQDLNPSVVNIIATGTDLPPVKPPKPSMAESHVSAFKASKDAAEALANEAGIADEIDLKAAAKAHAKVTIRSIFHGQ